MMGEPLVNSNMGQETANSTTLSPKTELFVSALKDGGISFRVINIPPSTPEHALQDIVVLNETPRLEPTIRVFRGVNDLTPKTIFNQVAYAARNRTELGDIEVIPEVQPLVEKLAHEPTYDNLRVYIDTMGRHATPATRQRLINSLQELEDNILNGYSLRSSLLLVQFRFPAGNPTDAITPYVSGTNDPKEALGYGTRGGLIVIDLPASEIEPNGSEIAIKGGIKPEYITAIIPREPIRDANIGEELLNALKTLDEKVQTGVMSPEESQRAIKDIEVQQEAFDKEQLPKDVAAVQLHRTAQLQEIFPDIELDLQRLTIDAQQHNIDIYTCAVKLVYEHFDREARQLGIDNLFEFVKNNRMTYRRGRYEMPYELHKPNNEMLKALRGFLDYRIEREKRYATIKD